MNAPDDSCYCVHLADVHVLHVAAMITRSFGDRNDVNNEDTHTTVDNVLMHTNMLCKDFDYFVK